MMSNILGDLLNFQICSPCERSSRRYLQLLFCVATIWICKDAATRQTSEATTLFAAANTVYLGHKEEVSFVQLALLL